MLYCTVPSESGREKRVRAYMSATKLPRARYYMARGLRCMSLVVRPGSIGLGKARNQAAEIFLNQVGTLTPKTRLHADRVAWWNK